MKQLKIDWQALELAFDDRAGEFGIERADYFDRESGQVVFVDEHVRDTVSCIIDELDMDQAIALVARRCTAGHVNLHDDFSSVRLKKKVIAQPPVLLWPNLAAAQEVPPDIHEHLIKQLAKDEQM